MARLLPQRGVMGPLVVITMSWLLAGALLGPELGAGRPERAGNAAAPAGGVVAGAVAADPQQTQPAPPPAIQPVRPTTQPVLKEADAAELRRIREERMRNQEEIRRNRERLDREKAERGEPEEAPDEDIPPAKTPEQIREEARQRAEEEKRRNEERRRQAEEARRGASQPAASGEASMPVTQPSGVSASAGRRQAVAPVAEDGRTEWFYYEGKPWEDVLRDFVERIGKPLIGEMPFIAGELTYKGRRKMTKEEALDELNLLLHFQDYRFVELEDYVMFVPLTSEMPKHVKVSHVYPTVQAFEEDTSLRRMDYVTVYIHINDRPASAVVEMFGDMIPDYARFTALADTNDIRFTGLVKDIRDFLALYAKAPKDPDDPRKMKVFPIKTNAAVVEQMVRSLLNVRTGPQVRINPRTNRPEAVEQQEDLRIMADDRTNTLIVKGTPDELRKVEELLAELDKTRDIGEFVTRVHEVRYGNAGEIANLLNQIFQQEQGQASPGQRVQRIVRPPQPGQRAQPVQPQPQQPNQPAPQDIFVEDVFERAKKTVRLVADERTNTLIVYANEEGQERVRTLLETIDKPVPTNFKTFALKNARAETIQPVVEQIARQGGGRGVRGVTTGATVLADTTANVLHVIAEREAMAQVQAIIEQLDVEGPAENRHIVELRNVRPSEMVPYVQALLEGDAGAPAAAPARPGVRPALRGVRAQPSSVLTAKVIALDSAGLLMVICTDEQWNKVETLIKLYDEKAVSNRDLVRSFKIKSADANTIAAALTVLYRQYNHPTLGSSNPIITPIDDSIYVSAIQPALDEIEAMIRAMDVAPDVHPLTIMPLKYADAAQVAVQVQPLLGGGAGAAAMPRGVRGGAMRMPGAAGGAGGTVEADTTINALIIRADGETVERILGGAGPKRGRAKSPRPRRPTR